MFGLDIFAKVHSLCFISFFQSLHKALKINVYVHTRTVFAEDLRK